MMYRSCSIKGPKGENQDAILEPLEVGFTTWCAIADGVGSAASGGLAALSSLQVVGSITDPHIEMSDLFKKVANRLSDLSKNEQYSKSLSTTLSVLCISGELARIGHVGDTRITHIRSKGIMTRTKDQTEVQKLLDDGVISKNQAKRYPRRNVLLSAMSDSSEYDLFESSFPVQTGDRILLTSDGFHSVILRGYLSEMSAKEPCFNKFWQNIVSKLNSSTLMDDASCLALEIE